MTGNRLSRRTMLRSGAGVVAAGTLAASMVHRTACTTGADEASVIGAGAIGSVIARAVLDGGEIKRVTLYDTERGKAERLAEQLRAVGYSRVVAGRTVDPWRWRTAGCTSGSFGQRGTNGRQGGVYRPMRMNTTKPIRASASVKAMPRNIVVRTMPAASG